MNDVYWEEDRPGTMRKYQFRAQLPEFSMGQLKWMFKVVRTKGMINYYGANLSKIYRQAIYDRIVSRKVRGIEYEVWRE